jgi:hypothetical protein
MRTLPLQIPWRISFLVEGGGLESLKLRAALSGVLSFASSENRLFNNSVNLLKYIDISVLIILASIMIISHIIMKQSITITMINYLQNQIKCNNFNGKGTIDDYAELFNAASKIASESKQMALDIDIEGFNEFATAADDLSALFNSFILKLQNVNIINDTNFLTSILHSLQSIVNLSNTFGKFKETILATTTIQLPKSAHDSKVILQQVANELNCAMKYISYFVDSSNTKPNNADLSADEQSIISSAVNTIDNWNNLCDQGITIALNNNPDIQYINEMNTDLKSKTNILVNATNTLKNKFAFYNITR